MSDAKTGSASGGPDTEVYTRAEDLPDDAPPSTVKPDALFIATVQNVVDYGVFVALTPSYGSDISGLVHKTNLPPNTDPEDYRTGDTIVVELIERKDDGDLGFRGHASPDAGGPDIADLYRSFSELREKVETLGDGGAGLSEDHLLETQGIPAARAKLAQLDEDEYSLEAFTTDAREGGDVVELSVTLTRGDGR